MAGKTKRAAAALCALAVLVAPVLSGSHSSAQATLALPNDTSASWLGSLKESAEPIAEPVVQPSVEAVPPEPAKPTPSATTTLSKLGGAKSCNGTQLNIVAHQDDDILFMNPDLQDSITNGVCMRTVYITAGDNGSAAAYWQERERGPDAAYAAMYGAPNEWTVSTQQLAGQTVTVHRLNADPRVSLVYMRLPDGNLTGKGFLSTGLTSLHALETGEIETIKAVDGSAEYSDQQLVTSLRSLMELDRPQILNAQAEAEELAGGDHSDHQAVGRYTERAAEQLRGSMMMRHYLAYQINGSAANLSEQEVAQKQSVFTAYAAHDSEVCNSTGDCFNDAVYHPYYSRQYTRPN